MWIFSYPSIWAYVMGAQKNCLIEKVLLSTHNICFGWEIRKNIFLVRFLNLRPDQRCGISMSYLSDTNFYCSGQVEYHRASKISIIYLFNMCFGCSKELSHRDSSFEYPQHMFWLRNKKFSHALFRLILGPGIFHPFFLWTSENKSVAMIKLYYCMDKRFQDFDRVPTVIEKSGKNEKISRSGKSQGILSLVREIWNFGKIQGNVREF